MLIALLFVVSVVAVYLFAAAVVVRLVRVRRLRSISAFDRVILILAGAGILCIAYGHWIEPNWLSKSYVVIRSSKIPAGRRAIRLLHFSVCPSESCPRLEPPLGKAAAAAHPDLIVFTGDSLNSPSGLPVLRECIEAL